MKTVFDYESADKFLGKKQDRPFAHNTRIARCDEPSCIVGLYHGSAVSIFYPDRTEYSSCGWKTPTTKERLNWFLPKGFSVYQSKSIWHLVFRNEGEYNADQSNSWVFQDGLTISNGIVSKAGSDKDVETTAKLIKKIKVYADGYVVAFLKDKVPAPYGGDCWGCCMVAEDGSHPLGRDGDHLREHMKEKYYVPSLLVNAMKQYPMCNMAQWMLGIKWGGQGEDNSDFIKDAFIRDATKSIVRYMKHELGVAE